MSIFYFLLHIYIRLLFVLAFVFRLLNSQFEMFDMLDSFRWLLFYKYILFQLIFYNYIQTKTNKRLDFYNKKIHLFINLFLTNKRSNSNNSNY